jgi:DNA-binding LacI/PurR family transcriptional regulator
VDQRTVSIALGASGRISDKMRERVLLTAHKMGYRHNRLAAGLRGAKTNSIGIIWLFADAWAGDADIAMRLLKHAQDNGLQVYQAQLPDEDDRIVQQIDEMLSRRVDALIIQGSRRQLTSPMVVEKLAQAPMVIGVCPEPLDDFPGDLVLYDRMKAIEEVVDHFANTGRKKPMFCINMDQEHNPPKFETFRKRCQIHGMLHDNMLLEIGNMGSANEYGPRHASNLSQRFPDNQTLLDSVDCIFTFNDIGAIFLMRELQDRKINIPEQIAVVGFNDIEVGHVWKPALATGNRKREELSNLLMQMLDTRLENNNLPHRRETVHMQFICRESAG